MKALTTAVLITPTVAEAATETGVVSAAQVGQVVVGLLVVLALIIGLAWLARNVLRIQPQGRGKLRVLGGLSIGSRERVVLVQAGEQQLLLGVAPGRVQTLHVLDEPIAEEPAAAPANTGFAAVLQRLNKPAAGS